MAMLPEAPLDKLKTMVKLWNRSMTAFVSMDSDKSPVEALDSVFTEKLLLHRSDGKVAMPFGFAIFLGCACSMLTFVAEQLALAAQRHYPGSASDIQYPPYAPRLLLALKRDNVLERNDGRLRIKPKYLQPVRNFVTALSPTTDASDDALLLFVSLFQTLPREAFPEAFGNMFEKRKMLASVEKILTPFAIVTKDDVAEFVPTCGNDEALLMLLCNSIQHLEYPYSVVQRLEDMTKEKMALVEHVMELKKGNLRNLVDLVVPFVVAKAVPQTAITAWERDKDRLAEFLHGVMLALSGTSLTAAELLGKSLNCSARHVVGFLALGRGDTSAVVELVSDVAAATEDQASSLRSLFALALPMHGLYENEEPEAEEEKDEIQGDLSFREIFGIAQRSTLIILVETK